MLADTPGVERYSINLEKKTVFVEGSASPAVTAKKFQELGRTAIVRGLGNPDTAAVAILEKHGDKYLNTNVFGLARLVEASSQLTLCDLTIKGLPKGTYDACIHALGDVRQGETSAGPVWERGVVGSVDVDDNGRGQTLLEMQNVRIWEIIGRALVVKARNRDTESLSGVVARSAGAWENTKTVCTCSGLNVWDERQEMLQIGSTL
ncbi:copper chaperone [Savitreella phatthalungensis]